MTPRPPSFTYPETNNTKTLHAAVKTRQAAPGQFEAVAAFWFGGVRQNIAYRVANTRARAQRRAMKAIGCE